MDEVDPGSGGAETTDPVALSSATTLEEASPSATADVLDTSTSLRERFVRASSPRVELSEEEDKSNLPLEGDEGRKREGETVAETDKMAEE